MKNDVLLLPLGFNICFKLIIASLEIYLVGLKLIQNITV